MNVQELINLLEKIENKELPVAVFADHGQHAIDAFSVNLVAVYDTEDYMMDVLHPDDWEGCGVTNHNYVLIEG